VFGLVVAAIGATVAILATRDHSSSSVIVGTSPTETGGTTTAPTTTGAAGGGDAAKGKMLYVSLGCQGCHTLDGTKSAGPTFKGLAGSQVKLASGETVTADDAYLLESIRDPDKQIVAGYAPGIMSAVIKPGQVSMSDAQDLIAFIKTVK
jgi:cytochrome c oxidase subunit 2